MSSIQPCKKIKKKNLTRFLNYSHITLIDICENAKNKEYKTPLRSKKKSESQRINQHFSNK